MIAVKNPNELACCKCKYQNKYRCSNGWTCSLTLEEGYPCYADALDRLDNCPFNPLPIEHRYAGTKELITEKEKITMELRRKWFGTASKLTEFVRTNNIEKENIQGIFLTYFDGYELFYWVKVFAN